MPESSVSNHHKGKAAGKKPTSGYRKLRRKFSKTNFRLPLVWLRHKSLRPADVFFGSYPRSGTTWSRFTLYEILTGAESKFSAVNAGICPIGSHRHSRPLLPGQGRLIATHEQYRTEYKKAVYIVRDCRDVLLSEFAYTRALEFFDGDLDEFVRQFFCGKVNPFGPWQRHVSSWLDSPIAATGNLLVVRYEDLRKDPVEGFTKVGQFLQVDVSQERIRLAIANNSLDKMREKEELEPQRASVKDRFIRSGLVQGWRSKLGSEQLGLIEEQAGGLLLRLGYPSMDQAKEVSESTGVMR